jgi:hypothetical protein
MVKLALPLRVSTSAFWLLPVAVRSLVEGQQALDRRRLVLAFALDEVLHRHAVDLGVHPQLRHGGRTSTVPLASKLPLYRPPRRVSRVSRPPWPLALSRAF